MQDEINELLKQLDSIEDELRSYDDELSEINAIRKRRNAIKRKLKTLASKGLKTEQKKLLVSPGNIELVVSKKTTKILDVNRLKEDGLYEKYTLLKETVKIEEKQRTLDDFNRE